MKLLSILGYALRVLRGTTQNKAAFLFRTQITNGMAIY
jgi:hypothetical protein